MCVFDGTLRIKADKTFVIGIYLFVVCSSPPVRLNNDFVFLLILFVIDHFVCNHGKTI